MNRRPSQSRRSYNDFSAPHTAHFKASSPDTRFFEKRKKRSLSRAILLVSMLAACIVLLGNFIVNRFVFLSRVDVPVTQLSEAFDGYTLLHISDLKGASFGSSQQRIASALRDTEFDAVLFTGDMLSPLGNAQPFYALIDALNMLQPDAPIYFIAGDSDPVPTSEDYSASGSPLAPWVLGAQQRDAVLLSAPQRVMRGEQTLWLSTTAQLNLDLETTQQQYTQAYRRAKENQNTDELELAEYNLGWLQSTIDARKVMREEDAFITLTHVPPTQEELPDMSGGFAGEIDLMLCGHYLGGLMRLPLIGPLFVPSQSLPLYGLFPGNDAFSGLRRSGHTWVYTSPGLGGSDPLYPPFFFRLFNPPTVTLLTLTPSAL